MTRALRVVMVALLVGSCEEEPPPPPAASPTAEHAPSGGEHSDHPHWTYEGESGPAAWGRLAPDWEVCASGHAQSPIDIGPGHAVDLPALRFFYTSTPVSLRNNGHTVEQSFPIGMSLDSGGRPYSLKQFHVHAPSEHTRAGESFPMEIHFVHRDASGALAVVGVWVREGEANPALEPFFANLPAHAGESSNPAGHRIDPNAILPVDRLYARYTGSLTTPPCSENVAWHVLSTPISASAEQIARFRELFSTATNRPVQPLGERPLDVDSTP